MTKKGNVQGKEGQKAMQNKNDVAGVHKKTDFFFL